MRSVYISFVLLMLSLSLGVVGELNNLNIRDKGYPLFFYGNTGYLPTNMTDSATFNQTLSNYGLDRVPSQSYSSYYLGSGGQLMMTYNAFKDFFMFTSLGVSTFIETSFPSTPPTILMEISVAVSIMNLISAISFLRGVGIKWI
jgi:hypothetical protein